MPWQPLVAILINAGNFISEDSVLEHLRLFSEVMSIEQHTKPFCFTLALTLYQKEFRALVT